MSRTLAIELLDEVYKVLEELTTEVGKSVHELRRGDLPDEGA